MGNTATTGTVNYADIEGPLNEIRRWRVNADYLAQDIIDDYFDPTYDSDETKAMHLAYDHERNAARMDMLYEALYKIRLSLEALDSKLQPCRKGGAA